MNPAGLPEGVDYLLTPEFDTWVKTAKDFAEKPEHWIDAANGETARKHVDELRFKHGEKMWGTHLVFWYSVEIAPDGLIYRHISIECSQAELGAHDAGQYKQAIEELKPLLLEFFRPLITKFWPIHTEMGGGILFHVSVGYKGGGQPVPVQDPTTHQFTYRMPWAFHFLVPWEGNVEELAAKYQQARNVAVTDPRVLGWKPGDEPPESDGEFLAWTEEDDHGLWSVVVWDGATWLAPTPPTWWRELPEPPSQ